MCSLLPETGTCKPKPEEETCMGYMERGQNTSGVYTLKMEDGLGPLDVFCDMTTDGGGWVVSCLLVSWSLALHLLSGRLLVRRCEEESVR